MNFFGNFGRKSGGLPGGESLLPTPKGEYKGPMNLDMLARGKSTESLRSMGGTRITRQ